MYVNYNPNPAGKSVGDCVVRAISAVTGEPWETTYLRLMVQGYQMSDLPSANAVWGAYLHRLNFEPVELPDICPSCYTVRDFADEHQNGAYVLALSGHVVAVVDGDYLDAWDSGDELPLCVWKKKGR